MSGRRSLAAVAWRWLLTSTPLVMALQGGCAPPPVAWQPVSPSRTVVVRVEEGGAILTRRGERPPASVPTSQPVDPRARTAFETVSRVLGLPGQYKSAEVYLVAVPRPDLAVFIEGMEVPTAAGIESTFHFYFCPCGKTSVIGQFCVADYEVNDVIDALRAARLEIASIAPMVLHTKQSPILIRFFAEGQPEPIAGAIREALRWTAKERMAPGK